MTLSADDWGRATVVPGPGGGTLARIGPVVLLVGSTDPDVVRPYIDHAQMVAANGGQGRQLVRGYALMLSTAVDDSPGFAALAPHSTGLAVFVDGDVMVTINGEQISGADSLAWVERLIPWPVESVEAHLAGSDPADAGAAYRLDGGIVPAGSFAATTAGMDSMVMPAPMAVSSMSPIEAGMATGGHNTLDVPERPAAPAAPEVPETPTEAHPPPSAQPSLPPAPPAPPTPPATPVAVEPPSPPVPAAAPAPPPPAAPFGRPLPPAAPDEHVDFQSVLIDDIDDEDFEPLPIVDDARQVVDASAPQEHVRGVYCKNRHFNDPRQLFCAVCGINMVQQTPVLVDGVRPPLGVIVLDDGSVFQLDTPYLLGRDPDADERVRDAEFRGLPIIDQSNQVSRVHARLELRGWDVVLIDNNSTNGTFIHVPKAPDWQRLPAGGEHVLVQGTRVRIGHRTLAFNTHAGGS